jgi:hypothetical protein
VDQGLAGVAKSLGSQIVRCDQDISVNFFTLQQIQRIDPVPRDLNGVPQRFCSGYLHGGHYSPLSVFGKDKSAPGGFDRLCKQCRADLREHHKATART